MDINGVKHLINSLITWLAHVAKYNPRIESILFQNKSHLPEDIWNMSFSKFKEK
jgi:hypothetical protein